mgnify:CR=1 FL=1
MLIVPVVFFSIVSGVTNLEDTTSLGRIGGKSIFLYLFTTFIAISFALIVASIINPGENANFVLEKDFKINSPPPITSVIENLIPKNPVKAFSEGNMLQIIVFAIIVGITITKMQIGQKVKLKGVFTSLNDLFLKTSALTVYRSLRASNPYGMILTIPLSINIGYILSLAEI